MPKEMVLSLGNRVVINVSGISIATGEEISHKLHTLPLHFGSTNGSNISTALLYNAKQNPFHHACTKFQYCAKIIYYLMVKRLWNKYYFQSLIPGNSTVFLVSTGAHSSYHNMEKISIDIYASSLTDKRFLTHI